MAEILSQSQIDELLNNLSSGDVNIQELEANDKKIKDLIRIIVRNNHELMFYENGQIKAIVKQRLGKKRERILLHIIEEIRSV